MYIHIHFTVHLKLTQHFKSTSIEKNQMKETFGTGRKNEKNSPNVRSIIKEVYNTKWLNGILI